MDPMSERPQHSARATEIRAGISFLSRCVGEVGTFIDVGMQVGKGKERFAGEEG